MIFFIIIGRESYLWESVPQGGLLRCHLGLIWDLISTCSKWRLLVYLNWSKFNWLSHAIQQTRKTNYNCIHKENKPKKCSFCRRSIGHNKTNCPNRHWNFILWNSRNFSFSTLLFTFILISLQENALLVSNFSDHKLLITIMTNLDTSLQSTKNYRLLK